jgi:ribosomal protein S18 acetylase RimI-like enzyme
MTNSTLTPLRSQCIERAGSELSVRDLDIIARLHMEYLQDSLFSTLGYRVTRCLYGFMARSRLELFVISYDTDSEIIGASIVSLEPHTFLLRLLTGSLMILWLMKCIFKIPWKRLRDKQSLRQTNESELMFLYVASKARFTGLGRVMVRLSESIVERYGKFALTVKTEDSPGNHAVGFYTRLNYSRVGYGEKFGKPFLLLRRALS